MIKDPALREGFRKAREITKKYAKTFYFTSHFLPKPKRLAAYSVYAICRISDEAVDGSNAGKRAELLARIENNISAAYGQETPPDALLAAFQDTLRRYFIPKEYFDDLISGMQMDLEKDRYADFEELYKYCYKVAGVIGLIMLKILGSSNPQAETQAINLGIAMQLTNILRDIEEDLKHARIYLPQQELSEFGVTENQLKSGTLNKNFKDLISFEIERARKYYTLADTGIKYLKDPSSRMVAMAMKDLYSGILDSIEKNGYDIFTERAHLNLFQKIRRLTIIIFGFKYL